MSTETNVAISPLVADLITASMKQTHATTNYLIDRLTEQVADRDAELAAIRDAVTSLLDGPYMPTPAAIQRALYPSPELVDTYRQPEER